MASMQRCGWAGTGDPLMVRYHDEEWGRPSRGERHLFEMLTLEGAQAGLSWSTILHRREGYRRAFQDFDVDAVARYESSDVDRLLADTGIVRNRAKVEAAIGNARATLRLRDGGAGLAGFLWAFVDDRPLQNAWPRTGGIPAETPESNAMSRELRHRGFRFVGPTICYALMQAVGIVNDHTVDCFRWRELGGGSSRRP
jgi:DNA-3-methyladenine glycosylase I